MGVNLAIANSSHELEEQMDLPWKRHAGLGGRGAGRRSAGTTGLLPDVLRDPARRLEPGSARGEHQAGRLGVRNAQGLPDALPHRSGVGGRAVAEYQIFSCQYQYTFTIRLETFQASGIASRPLILAPSDLSMVVNHKLVVCNSSTERE